MKKIKYLLLLSLISNIIIAQDTVIVYYNQDWEKIDNKDYASFYRKAFYDSTKLWRVRDYFISGKIQMEGAYKTKKEKKQAGYFSYYYENGQKQSEGYYAEGLKKGAWTQWHENGALQSEGKYKDGELNGTWLYLHENGKKKSTGRYTDGEREEEWGFWFQNGNPKAKGGYTHSLKNGEWTYYHENGQISSEGNYADNLANGEWTYWYESGEQQSKGVWVSGKKNGVWKYWYKNGILKSEETFSKEELTSSIGYHANGNLDYKGNYQNGVPHGKWIYSNAYGNKFLEGNFNKGRKEGEWIRYFPDSQMKLYFEKGKLQNKKLGGIIKANK